MLLMPVGAVAQVAELEAWVKKPAGELAGQKFAVAALDKAECGRAAEIVDSLWMDATAKRLYRTWGNMTISNDSIKLSCAVRTFGLLPKDGRSLYISMHGGGHCPKEVNDEQWVNQIYLYEPKRVFTSLRVRRGTLPIYGTARGLTSFLRILSRPVWFSRG